MAHVNHPVHAGANQVKAAFMNPFGPVTVFVIHVFLHFLLLTFVNPCHARNGHQISALGHDDGKHVPLLSAWIANQKVSVGPRVFLRLGLKAFFREPLLEQINGLIGRHVAFQFFIPFECTL